MVSIAPLIHGGSVGVPSSNGRCGPSVLPRNADDEAVKLTVSGPH